MFKTSAKDERIAKAHINDYEQSTAYELSDVYGRYSHRKANAFKYCEDLYKAVGGIEGIRILSHNTFTFSVGFLFTDKENGHIRFAYITADYNRACDY
jgi:hypothetical protein